MNIKKAVLFIFISVFSASCSGGGTPSNGGNGNGGSNTCTSDPFFSVSPISISDIESTNGLVPLGNLNPPGHTFPSYHIYFYIKDSDGTPGAPTNLVNLYAPGNITITSIASSENLTVGVTDYTIYFQPCDEFQGYFGHVSSLAEMLKAAFDAATGDCQEYTAGVETFRMCTKNVDISANAGEIIGTAGGPDTNSVALDFGGRDGRIEKLSYVNPERIYEDTAHGFDFFHVVCPIDYYTSDMKTQLEAKLNRAAGATPLCGTVAQDKADTAQGKWFAAGTTGIVTNEANHLALVHDNKDPSKPVFSVGNSTLGTGLFNYTPQNAGLVNRDFGDIASDGNVYCFDGITGHASNIIFLVQLTSSTGLKIERRSVAACGADPYTFTASAMDFER